MSQRLQSLGALLHGDKDFHFGPLGAFNLESPWSWAALRVFARALVSSFCKGPLPCSAAQQIPFGESGERPPRRADWDDVRTLTLSSCCRGGLDRSQAPRSSRRVGLCGRGTHGESGPGKVMCAEPCASASPCSAGCRAERVPAAGIGQVQAGRAGAPRPRRGGGQAQRGARHADVLGPGHRG